MELEDTDMLAFLIRKGEDASHEERKHLVTQMVNQAIKSAAIRKSAAFYNRVGNGDIPIYDMLQNMRDLDIGYSFTIPNSKIRELVVKANEIIDKHIKKSQE